MLTKNLNDNIVTACRILNVLLILYFAILSAHVVWWVLSPTVPEVYLTKGGVKTFDNSVKSIINRIPFGEIVVKESAVAVVKDDIKLTGVYLNTSKDSIAFLEVNKKPMIVKLGDQIVPGTFLKSIYPESIVITQDSSDITMGLDKGSGGSGAPDNSGPVGAFGNRGGIQQSQTSYIPEDARNQQSNSGNMPGNDRSEQMEEMRARRKRMIEEFAERAREESPNNADR